MKVISTESYCKKIAWHVEVVLEDALCDFFNELAEEYGFDKATPDEFHESYMLSNRWGELRDIALDILEQAGMDVRADGDWWEW